MEHGELAAFLAPFLILYEHARLAQYVRLPSRLMEHFFEHTVSGLFLVGDHAIPPGEFLGLVVNGLNASDECRPVVGQKAALRRFIFLHYGESH
jgi:hypothetical protein